MHGLFQSGHHIIYKNKNKNKGTKLGLDFVKDLIFPFHLDTGAKLLTALKLMLLNTAAIWEH